MKRPESIPVHYERQFLQYLEVGGWVKATELPNSPGIIERLLAKGWIERKLGPSDRVFYRITEKGIAAKKVPIP